MAADPGGAPKPGKGGLVALVALTLVAGGAGYGAGRLVWDRAQAALVPAGTADAPGANGTPGQAGPADGGHGGKAQDAAPDEHAAGEAPPAPVAALVALPPLLTAIREPADVWVRLELVLGAAVPLPPGRAEAVGQDLLAYLRTLRLETVEGGAGFRELVAELDERARLSSEGAVVRVFVRTLLFE